MGASTAQLVGKTLPKGGYTHVFLGSPVAGATYCELCVGYNAASLGSKPLSLDGWERIAQLFHEMQGALKGPDDTSDLPELQRLVESFTTVSGHTVIDLAQTMTMHFARTILELEDGVRVLVITDRDLCGLLAFGLTRRILKNLRACEGYEIVFRASGVGVITEEFRLL